MFQQKQNELAMQYVGYLLCNYHTLKEEIKNSEYDIIYKSSDRDINKFISANTYSDKTADAVLNIDKLEHWRTLSNVIDRVCDKILPEKEYLLHTDPNDLHDEERELQQTLVQAVANEMGWLM